MQRRPQQERGPSSRPTSPNANPTAATPAPTAINDARTSIFSQLLSLLTRILLSLLSYPLRYLPKPIGLNSTTSTSDAFSTKQTLNIPSNLGLNYPLSLKKCCPDLVDGEMPEYRLLILIIHSPLHPLSCELITSLKSSPDVPSGEFNLLIVSTSTAEGRLLSQKYGCSGYPWTGIVSPLDFGSSGGVVRDWESSQDLNVLYNQGFLLGRLKSSQKSSQIIQLSTRVSTQWSSQISQFTSRRYSEFSRRQEMLNQNLEFERVQREDKERMELREKEEKERKEEEERRERELKDKVKRESEERESKRNRIPPSAGPIRLKFVLPGGQSFTYSFEKICEVSLVRDCIDVKVEENGWGIKNYDLVSRSERKKIGEGEIGDWCEGGVVMVADLDA